MQAVADADSTPTEKFEYDDEQVDGFEIGAKVTMARWRRYSKYRTVLHRVYR